MSGTDVLTGKQVGQPLGTASSSGRFAYRAHCTIVRSALHHCDRTGEGTVVDVVCLLDSR